MDLELSQKTITRQIVLLIALLGFMSATSGCYYYKSLEYDRSAYRPKKFSRKIHSSLSPGKYVIVHQGDSMWHLDNMVIFQPDRKKDRNPIYDTLWGNMEVVDSLCAFYHNKYVVKNRRAVRYFIHDEDHVISQVHVYLGDNNLLPANSLAMPVSSIDRVEEYKQATFRTQWPWIIPRICFDILLFCITHPGHHGHHNTSHSASQHAPNVIHGPRRG